MKRYFPRTVVRPGYTLIDIKETRGGETIALIDRNIRFCSYVVAWRYDRTSGEWGQGHYFEDLEDARAYYNKYR